VGGGRRGPVLDGTRARGCCDNRPAAAGEKGAWLAQKLGQLQPFTAVSSLMHGPTCIVWANLTPFSLSPQGRMEDECAGPNLFLLEYNDGFRAAVLIPPRAFDPQKLFLGAKEYLVLFEYYCKS
jgi:hypothetical protein